MIKGALTSLSPFTKLLFVFALVLLSSTFITMLFVIAALPFSGIEEFKSLATGEASVSYLRYLQVIQGFTVFIIPSIIVAWLFSKNPALWLGFRKVNWLLLALSAGLFIACQPLVSHLAKLNAAMELPGLFQPVETWMKLAEKSAGNLIYQFLDTGDPWVIGVNVVMIVLMPSIGEELLFRGTIQPLAGQWFKNNHLAIWITAFIFSAMHLQFFTFLPRFLLGGLLGYLMFYGKNIWFPIIGHFVNNMLSLSVFYYFRAYKPGINPLDADAGNYSNLTVIMSLLMVAITVLYFKHKANRHTLKNGDQL